MIYILCLVFEFVQLLVLVFTATTLTNIVMRDSEDRFAKRGAVICWTITGLVLAAIAYTIYELVVHT